MYYLRKEPYKKIIPPIKKTDGTVVPERQYETEDRAIYKHGQYARFYRGVFTGISSKYQGMKLYTCKTTKKIMKIRKDLFQYCGEYFDVYNEDGKVDIDAEWYGK